MQRGPISVGEIKVVSYALDAAFDRNQLVYLRVIGQDDSTIGQIRAFAKTYATLANIDFFDVTDRLIVRAQKKQLVLCVQPAGTEIVPTENVVDFFHDLVVSPMREAINKLREIQKFSRVDDAVHIAHAIAILNKTAVVRVDQ